MMPISIQVLLLVATTLYQLIASWPEDRQPPPGQLIDVGKHRLHLYVAGEAALSQLPQSLSFIDIKELVSPEWAMPPPLLGRLISGQTDLDDVTVTWQQPRDELH